MSITHICHQLEQVYNGEPWYGDPILKKINAISATAAFAQPMSGIHSIAEIVGHMIAWRRATIEWLRGNRDFTLKLNSTDDWIPYHMLQPVGWNNLKSQLQETQTQLIALLKNETNEILSLTYSPQPYTFQFLLEGIIQHDIYHLGQIGIVHTIVSART